MTQDQLFETLWGGAIADAIGNPLEFQTEVTDADFRKSMNQSVLYPSDDTQMTLFVYEALHSKADLRDAVVRWYKTQSGKPAQKPSKGLLQFGSLYRREAPGSTCMGSAAALARGQSVDNDSKGNGTVMRAAPFAVVAHLSGSPDEYAYLLAKVDALLTHKHRFAWQSSVLLVGIYLNLFRGATLPVAVFDAVKSLPSCAEVGALVMTMFTPMSYEVLRARRCGWVAEEALALAVGANLHHKGYLNIVREACKGVQVDSDTVAGIAGGIASATGQNAPEELKGRLYCGDAIRHVIGLFN